MKAVLCSRLAKTPRSRLFNHRKSHAAEAMPPLGSEAGRAMEVALLSGRENTRYDGQHASWRRSPVTWESSEKRWVRLSHIYGHHHC